MKQEKCGSLKIVFFGSEDKARPEMGFQDKEGNWNKTYEAEGEPFIPPPPPRYLPTWPPSTLWIRPLPHPSLAQVLLQRIRDRRQTDLQS